MQPHAKRAPGFSRRNTGAHVTATVLALHRNRMSAAVEHDNSQRHHFVCDARGKGLIDDFFGRSEWQGCFNFHEITFRNGQRSPC